MEDVWKDIPGYEGFYQVNNNGGVRSVYRLIVRKRGRPYIRTGYKMSLHCDTKGYNVVNLTKFCVSQAFKVHRLVAIVFIPNQENKPFVNHINGIKTDNRVENLEWCTAKENSQHAFKIGLNRARKGAEHASFGKQGHANFNPNKVQCLCTGRILDYSAASEELSVSRNYFVRMMVGIKNNWTNFILLPNPKRHYNYKYKKQLS